LLSLLPALASLDLSNCSLTGELDLDWLMGGGRWGGHGALTVLRLSGNGLTSVREADSLWRGALPVLTELYLDNNALAAFAPPPPGQLPTLTDPSAGFCAGAGAGSQVAAHGRLRVLDLSNNALTAVDPRLATEAVLPALSALLLGGNPLRAVRPAVVAAGPVAVLRFLRERVPEAEAAMDLQQQQQHQYHQQQAGAESCYQQNQQQHNHGY